MCSMDRKTKHRILGVLVVIGLVIILLPLFQGRKEGRNDTALVTAPPFPDQSIQVASAAGEQKQITPAQESNIPTTITDSTPDAASSIGGVKQQPDDTIGVTHTNAIKQDSDIPVPDIAAPKPAVNLSANTTVKPVIQLADNTKTPAVPENNPLPEISDNTPPAPAITQSNASEVEYLTETGAPKPKTKAKITHAVFITKKPVKSDSHKSIESKKNTQAVKTALTSSKSTSFIKPHLASLKAPIDENGLAKLKSAAWVIQIGSYKDKTNALRMVNQLRENGYNAFIQQITTALGDHTRVFVGPEIKLNSARALAGKLQNEMHIQGIVISYKPLTL
jgi:DedD protein